MALPISSERYRILGIDPGLNRLGYALIEVHDDRPMLIEGGLVRSTQGTSLSDRVGEIGAGVREIVQEFTPQAVAIEQVFSHAQFPKTAVLMAHARGAVLFVATDAKVPIAHYSATQIKRHLTGSGRSSKEQMQFAVMQAFGLKKLPEPHDVADASAIALCHYHHWRAECRKRQSA